MSGNDCISRMALYEKTAEWEAQALHMVELHLHDEDKAEWRKWSTVLAERSAFKHDVAAAPVIDVKPVVKGEWIEAQLYWDNVYTCSACGSEFVLIEGTPKDNEYNFCPNCGADMREDSNE